MSLTSQLITPDFPDLDKVERLNIEAFPEEERIPLDEYLRYTHNEDAHFFAFYNEEEFVGFAFAISNAKAFYVSFSLSCHIYVVMVMVRRSLTNWSNFMNEPCC